ncbi:MAG: DUF3772 domain-containing protein [Alphaproteobacteria bacterium]|nr:DUF3772 domain-containing protein [Alphaproteobacteria bacterium]
MSQIARLCGFLAILLFMAFSESPAFSKSLSAAEDATPEIISKIQDQPVLASLSPAQTGIEKAQTYSKETSPKLHAISLELDKIGTSLQAGIIRDDKLDQISAALNILSTSILQITKEVAPYLQEIREQIYQLGPAPKENGGIESSQITEKRKRQEGILANYQGIETQARLLLVRIEQLYTRITIARRSILTERIFSRQRSAVNPYFWYDTFTALPILSDRLFSLIFRWKNEIRSQFDLGLLGAALLAFSIIWRFTRHFCIVYLNRARQEYETPSDLQKAFSAIRINLLYLLFPILSLSSLYFLLSFMGLLTPKIDRILFHLCNAIVFYSFVNGLAIATLSPRFPKWRLIDLDDTKIKKIFFLIRSSTAVYTVGGLLNTVNAVLFAPLIVMIGKDILISTLIAILITYALFTIAKARKIPEQPTRTWLWFTFFSIVSLAMLTVISALLFGFVSLASFITSQLIIGITILIFLKLILKFADALLTQGLESPQGIGKKIAASTGMKPQTLVQLGIIANGLIRIILIFMTLLLLAIPWGIESTDIIGWLRTAFFGFTIGNFTLSFSSFLFGFGFFLFGIALTKSVRNWLENSYLPHTSLDIGVRNSVKTAFSYLGYILATMAGVSYIGLDLSKVAIVAGALSVGIGFGLQSIVNNFVSGLILLAERPIKAGDWIIANGMEGYVRKISVRATEIETFDRSSVIIPNSDLISSPVTNRMHHGNTGRIIIPVGVAYGSDSSEIRRVLMECAREHPGVLRIPEPIVFFIELGPYSLNFELRAYLNNINSGLSVKSDLHFSILEAFKKQKIEIPFPQQNITVEGLKNIENTLETFLSRKEKKPAQPPLSFS